MARAQPARRGRPTRATPVTEAALTDQPKTRRAPRRLVVIGVVVYCVLAWAAVFQIAKVGIGLFRHGDAHYAQSALPAKD